MRFTLKMKNGLWLFLVLFTTIVGLDATVRAQDTVRNISYYNRRIDSINSDILKQKRFIEVFTPANYRPGSADTYDVLYVLDGGNWNTGLILPIQHFVEGEGNMPPTIIVSVMGIDRNNELTPTHLESWKGSGGAGKFLGFIKNELIPYINKTYPSDGDNTLWGHSLGGMFVMYALLNETTTFKSYIAVDPSLWWDNCYVPKMAASKLPALTGNATLFISGREGPPLTEMKIDTMDIILKKMAPANLTWKLVVYPDETHSSVRLKSTYDGLKFTYAGLTNHIEFHPMDGIVLKDKPYKIWYDDDTARVHYTTDGTVPTMLSAKARHEITLTGPSVVTYKQFTNRSKYDKTATGSFTPGKMWRSVATQKDLTPGGFNYAYYEGDWDKWPDIKNLKPVKTGVTGKDFDVDNLPRKNNFALVVDGFLKTNEDGYYIFLMEADKNSKLYLDTQLLIEWEGDYNQRVYSYLLPLSKGFHHLRVEYLHKNKDFKLLYGYITPSNMDTRNAALIPFEDQYSSR